MRNVMTRAGTDSAGEPLSLSACLARLGEINRKLSQGTVDVEAALVLFEEGVSLHTKAEKILQQARLRVRQLTEQTGETPREEVQPADVSLVLDPDSDLPF